MRHWLVIVSWQNFEGSELCVCLVGPISSEHPKSLLGDHCTVLYCVGKWVWRSNWKLTKNLYVLHETDHNSSFAALKSCLPEPSPHLPSLLIFLDKLGGGTYTFFTFFAQHSSRLEFICLRGGWWRRRSGKYIFLLVFCDFANRTFTGCPKYAKIINLFCRKKHISNAFYCQNIGCAKNQFRFWNSLNKHGFELFPSKDVGVWSEGGEILWEWERKKRDVYSQLVVFHYLKQTIGASEWW